MTQTIPTPNAELFAEREDLLARVRILDAERDALITQREYASGKQLPHITAEIACLGKEANLLEKRAHEIYQRMYTNLVTVREDGSTYSAEITMSIGNDGRMGLGPIWTLVLVEQNNETECEKLQREISDDWERIPEIPF